MARPGDNDSHLGGTSGISQYAQQVAWEGAGARAGTSLLLQHPSPLAGHW